MKNKKTLICALVALVVVVLVVLWATGVFNGSSNKPAENATETVEQVKEAAEGAAEEVKEAAEEVKEAAEGAAEEAKEAVEGAAEEVKEAVEEAKDTTEGKEVPDCKLYHKRFHSPTADNRKRPELFSGLFLRYQ